MKNETKSKISYSILFKWIQKEDFQGWVSHPSHIEEHKNMRKSEKENTVSVNIEKQIKQFKLLDISNIIGNYQETIKALLLRRKRLYCFLMCLNNEGFKYFD